MLIIKKMFDVCFFICIKFFNFLNILIFVCVELL